MNQALALATHSIVWLLGAVAAVFTTVENAFHAFLDQMQIGPRQQSIIMLGVTVVLIVATFRVVGGLFRVLLVAFLALLLAHLLLPEFR